tara:strand:+ start:493 stop:1500 length:1008 start_codon:yes stop_codon:yes gene_type:complete
MKLLTFASFLILSINFIKAEHLDSSSYEIPLNCVIDFRDETKLIRGSQKAPVYPRGALEYGIEAIVQVNYDTNDKGEVINEYILWSVDSLEEISLDSRFDKAFERASLKSMKTAIYKASKWNKEGLLSSKNQVMEFVYVIEGEENTFALGPNFERTLKRAKQATTNTSKIPKALDSLDKIINSEKLIDVQRASFLYLKAFLIYLKNPNSEEIKPLLIEVRNLISTDLPYGPNVYKIKTFGSLLLGQVYINEQQWEKAIELLEEGIHSGRKGNILDKRFFNAHLQLGVAHYSSGNWCGAAKSWARAKMMSESRSTNYIFPDAFNVYVNYANSRLDP